MRVSETISIDDRLIEERFVRSSGPGGQNVNKVSTAVELRFDARSCNALDSGTHARLRLLAGVRMTSQGVLIIRAERFRTQELNRSDARARLIDLIRRASVRPKKRIATRPSRGAKERRLKAKTHRSGVKRMRQSKPDLS